MPYAWLSDSLRAIKAYEYFDIISNTETEGNLLISYTTSKHVIISILHTSRRCYKVSYVYVKSSVPVMLQEFRTFPTAASLCEWLKEIIAREFKSVQPKKRFEHLIKDVDR